MKKAIDYASRVTCASTNMQEFTDTISAMLRADGVPHSPAQKDGEGRCTTCGHVWLCPGVHTFEEIQEAARREARTGNPERCAPVSLPTPGIMAVFRKITPRGQCAAVEAMLRGKVEEWEFFAGTVNRLVEVWNHMPKSYETDGQGKAAVAQLHYFTGGCDWWIVEKDSDGDGEGQIQAFGVADLGQGCRELGYINLVEILAAGAELDFHYTPVTVGELLQKGGD